MIKMSTFKKSTMVHLIMGVSIFTTGLLINVVQCLLHFVLKPFSPNLFRHLMKHICLVTGQQLIFIFEFWSNSELELWIDEDDRKFLGKENALLILNHTYEIDWMCILLLSNQFDIIGNIKAYAKKSLSYIPCFGWGWKLAEFVFLERSYDKDREIITRQLQALMSYPQPVWLIFNAEGTRFTQEKYEASVKFAQKRGLPVLKHHLIPRTKGFTSSAPTLRNKCAIYDINLAFKKNDPVEPTICNLLNGNKVKAHMFVRRITFDKVPEEEDKAAEWLQQTFREKDRIQESFHTTGSFFETSSFKETQSEVFQPKIQVLINYVVWAVMSVFFIFYYLISSLISQNWIGLSLTLGILLTLHVFMRKSIRMSEINNASSFGAESVKRDKN